MFGLTEIHRSGRRRCPSLLALAAVVALTVSACGSSATTAPVVTTAPDVTTAPVVSTAPVVTTGPAKTYATLVDDAAGLDSSSQAWWTSRPAIANVTPTQPIKIAVMGFANNPYWVGIQNGAMGANEALRSKNVQVDWMVMGSTQDVPGVNAAVLAAASQGYKGIIFFITGPGNCPVIQQLSAQGIVLGVYNTLQPCVKDSGGLIDIAQAQYQAGLNSAKELIKAVGTKKGEVGIITSLFSAPGAEFRRTGFIDGLQGSNLTPVNKGVEAKDSAGTSFTLAQQFMTAVPDLVGIYCTAGGPFGAAQAVAAAHKTDTIKVIGYDMTTENAAALKDGSMYAVTGQDAYGQTYNGVVAIFNKIAANQNPPNVYQQSFSPWVTKANLSQYDPSTHSADTLGAS